MKKPTITYENNPFLIGLEGLKLLFKRGQSIAILAIVLCALGVAGQLGQAAMDLGSREYWKTDQQVQLERTQGLRDFKAAVSDLAAPQITLLAIVAASGLFVFILINLLIYGSFDRAAGRLSKDKDATLKESAGEVLRHIASYLWLNILIFVKVLMWSLLFIVPGIIMYFRYSLAGVAFFEEDLRGNKAIKRSLELTKGAWFTTFASHGLWNLLTLGLIQPLLLPGTSAVLYRQLAQVTDAKQDKPAAHWLSWLTVFVPIGLFLLLILMGVLIAIAVSLTTAP